MPNIGPAELIVVLVVALLVLGPKKLPAAGRSLGEGIRGFKESLTGGDPAKTESQALTADASEGSRDA
jgi:sec-independent protein translocase protein TatA